MIITSVRLSVADLRNLADVVVLEDADVVAPVDFSGVSIDIDNEACFQV